MVVERQEKIPRPLTEQALLRCPACAACVNNKIRLLDSNNGQTIELYRCDCGQRIWVDEPFG
jgi:hypothetical protein